MADEDLRLEVYQHFAAHGSAPLPAFLAEKLKISKDDAQLGLQRLASARHLALDSTGRSIVMAHPFSSVPLGFSVMGKSTLWWGGCAWDSFALPHLLTTDESVLVATRCPACDRALAWVVRRDAPPNGSEVAHFLVPVPQMWNDVVHTCGNQRLYCSVSCVKSWLEKHNQPEGYTMDLQTLWRLASQWYRGRLDRGYVRREPAAAKEYFKSVGLSGPFWGLQ